MTANDLEQSFWSINIELASHAQFSIVVIHFVILPVCYIFDVNPGVVSSRCNRLQ